MGVATLEALVLRLISQRAECDSVFSALDAELVAPHAPTLDELHERYAGQRALLAVTARYAHWFPGIGGGSTFCAALLAAEAVLCNADARVLLIATSAAVASELDDALALVVAREHHDRILVYEELDVIFDSDDGAFTHVIVDFNYNDDNGSDDAEELAEFTLRFCHAVDEHVTTDGYVRFVGNPPPTVHTVVEKIVRCSAGNVL
jgi:hypothetical protein